MSSIQSVRAGARHAVSGWWGVGAVAAIYALLVVLNFLLPIAAGTMGNPYAMRLWSWCQWMLAVTALVVTGIGWSSLTLKAALLAGSLGGLVAVSVLFRGQGAGDASFYGLAVLLAFLGGTVLFARVPADRQVQAFEGSAARVGRRMLVGLALALPLALLNNLYFYLNNGQPEFLRPLAAAGLALAPGIGEEVVFRFFIIALVMWLLRAESNRRAVMAAALVLSVVPHSLNHLPDLFLQSPVMGLVMLLVTSLLFGLPMALVNLKKGLEAGIAFHWLVDFLRFWFGY